MAPWYRSYPINVNVFQYNKGIISNYASSLKKVIIINRENLIKYAKCFGSKDWKDWDESLDWAKGLDKLCNDLANSIRGDVFNFRSSSFQIDYLENVCLEIPLSISGTQGILHKSKEDSNVCIIYEPGIGGDRVDHMRTGVMLAREFQKKGFNFFRYDFPGTGVALGEFSDYSWSSRRDVAKKIILYLKKFFCMKRFFFVTYSEGVKVALEISNCCSQVEGIVMWSPIIGYIDSNFQIQGTTKDQNNKFERGGVVQNQGYNMGFRYFVDNYRHDFFHELLSLDVEYAYIFGEWDENIESERLALKAKESIMLTKEHHLFSLEGTKRAIRKTIDFIERIR